MSNPATEDSVPTILGRLRNSIVEKYAKLEGLVAVRDEQKRRINEMQKEKRPQCEKAQTELNLVEVKMKLAKIMDKQTSERQLQVTLKAKHNALVEATNEYKSVYAKLMPSMEDGIQQLATHENYLRDKFNALHEQYLMSEEELHMVKYTRSNPILSASSSCELTKRVLMSTRRRRSDADGVLAAFEREHKELQMKIQSK